MEATDQQITKTALAIRNARTPAVNGQQITATALAIRSARAMEDYVGTVQSATKLAVEQSNTDGLDSLRDEIIELQQRSLELQENLVSAVVEMATSFKDAVPLVVNVPETNLTLQQQPVTVNLPKAAPVQVKPVIKVPATKVVIDKQKQAVPKRATITHADGSTSIIKIES
jgi:hypothetical protein